MQGQLDVSHWRGTDKGEGFCAKCGKPTTSKLAVLIAANQGRVVDPRIQHPDEDAVGWFTIGPCCAKAMSKGWAWEMP